MLAIDVALLRRRDPGRAGGFRVPECCALARQSAQENLSRMGTEMAERPSPVGGGAASASMEAISRRVATRAAGQTRP
jgi:hypothetical protein